MPVHDLAHDDSLARIAALEGTAQRLLELARGQGATQAEVSCSESRGLNVGVRMGEVETVESNQDRGIGVTVYFGRRKGSASTGDVRDESLAATVAQACAIARHTEEDEAAGLADADLMAKDLREFDTWHPAHVSADEAVARALACEDAGRAVDARIGNSDGASFGSGQSLGVYAN
jgi:PmbA protein